MSVACSSPVVLTQTSDFVHALGKQYLDIKATIETIECGLTLKGVRDMITTYSQRHNTEKYSQHCSIIWSVLINVSVIVSELSGCGFESSYSH